MLVSSRSLGETIVSERGGMELLFPLAGHIGVGHLQMQSVPTMM